MVNKKKDGRKLSREVLEQYRLRAIELRRKKWEVNDIALFFGLNRGSVSRWFTKHKRGGIKALRRRKAPGAQNKLSDVDIRKLLNCLKKPASNYGFETDLWDCKRVQQLTTTLFGKKIHISNIWRMLKKWGLTPQKPEKRAVQQNKKSVEDWLKNVWPKIKAHSRRWQAIIYFQDECGVSLIPSVGRTWAPKGKTPLIRTSGIRGGLSLTSAISPCGRMVFNMKKGKSNARKHIEFLQQILKHHPNRKIIIIQDNAPVHTAKKIESFIEENKKRIARYFLPPYSPELNPDEHTWRHLKKHELKTHRATTVQELRDVVLAKMRSIQRKQNLVESFFYGTYVT